MRLLPFGVISAFSLGVTFTLSSCKRSKSSNSNRRLPLLAHLQE